MALVLRKVLEQGIVLEKKISPAYAGGVFNGQVNPARPERKILTCVSSSAFNSEFGFTACSVLEYTVDDSTYSSAKYGDHVNVVLVVGGTKGARADSCQLIRDIGGGPAVPKTAK
jgi:hypothetical protein